MDSFKQHQDAFRKAQSILSNSLRRGGGVAVILIVALLALAAFWIIDKVAYYYVARGYVDQIGSAFDLNKNLVNALVLATFIVVIFLGTYLWSFSKKKRLIGFAGIGVLLIGHSLVLWWATREHYFDRTGIATKCYVVTRDGSVSYGERPGIDPVTGRQCRPVTTEVLERLKQYEKGKRPQLIASNEPIFFEPRTGEPIVWYYRSKSNGLEIFDLMGFHPETGEELLPIDKETVESWKRQTKQRLASVPRKVDPTTYALFDSRSGTPRVWYWRDKTGLYEFYDSPGFHPLTGQMLLVITPDIAEEARSKVEQRAPQPIDIKSYSPFDPKTGVARVWYSRDGKGGLEFFDAPGFHPRTGAKLDLFTKDVMDAWQREIREQEERIERDRRQRAEEMERERREFEAKAAAEREWREQEQRRISQAASRCDELAANPNDQKRVGSGVPFEHLKVNAREAITNCELAIGQNPRELRFKYQLARALHWTDRPRAFGILQQLAQNQYAAAFDNLGWLYLTERKDSVKAIQLFKTGMSLGDADAMVSLVEMIDRGHLSVDNPTAEKANLLCRAGQLGHQSAALSCQTAIASARQEEQNRIQQLQAQQMMLQFMGGVINNIPRR